MWLFRVQPWAAALSCVLGFSQPLAPPQDGALPASGVPAREVLFYQVEWRLIHAGNARLTWSPSENGDDGWQSELYVESVGLVSRLYKVNNTYSSILDNQLCVERSLLRTSEGSRKNETSVTFDRAARKARFQQRDLVKKSVMATHEIDIQPCEHDVIGALYQLRRQRLQPGESVQIPVSDGKKAVLAKVEAQERETIKTDSGTYKTVRYEAFLFNNVLYRRRGRLFVWLTDDDRKLPVQIRIRMPFYIGTVTLQLQKGKS